VIDHYTVKRLALVLAVQAEIEGMKSENAHRENCGNAQAYGDEDFQSKANELENLAHAHDEQV
tara:strand:+ start:779 stop:967 length:189 start_codon:yes stop_codon:yes gene_type:complete